MNCAPVRQLFKRVAVQHLWVVVILAGVFIFVNTHPIRPHDFWWHIAVGREILTTRQIPHIDIYSFTAPGAPYASYQMFWLMEMVLYTIYRIGGPALIVFHQSSGDYHCIPFDIFNFSPWDQSLAFVGLWTPVCSCPWSERLECAPPGDHFFARGSFHLLDPAFTSRGQALVGCSVSTGDGCVGQQSRLFPYGLVGDWPLVRRRALEIHKRSVD